MKNQYYDKLRHNIRQWLLGKNYHIALAAMELGLKHHTGFRKDGITPEFQHQVSQATFCRTLNDLLLFPEETISVIFLHDIVEDCNITHGEVREYLREKGATEAQLDLIMRGVELMTNQYGDGFVANQKSPKKPKEEYYEAMVNCPIASVCKGMDRMHNHQSMVGVFTPQKQLSYIAETRDYIIPMLKKARKTWSRQEGVLTNIKHILEVQMELVDALTAPTEESTGC